jgi:hypothetical protein
MLRAYIKNAIYTQKYLTDGGNSTVSKLNAMIENSISTWIEPKALTQPKTIRALIEYEVNAYLASLSKEAIEKIKTKKTAKDKVVKTAQLTGILQISSVNPPLGRIEDGTEVALTSIHPVEYGELLSYTYEPSSGIYTVNASSKGIIKALPGRVVYGNPFSEQFGQVIFDQEPYIAKASSAVIDEAKHTMLYSDSNTLIYRLGSNLACYVKNNKYTEFKHTKVGDKEGVEVTKEIDLTSYLSLNTGERLTIGKFLNIKNIVYIIVFKHTSYKSWQAIQSPNGYLVGQQYNHRGGGASVRGELLIIDRKKDTVNKISASAVSATEQIYFSGFIDMIKDSVTGQPIMAKLSESPHTQDLVYDTAKYFIAAADRKQVKVAVSNLTTVLAFDQWLGTEVYNYGFPTKVHIVKSGTKTWSLSFPNLNVSLYKADMSLDKVLYEESNKTINTKHGYVCKGGYTNCMLYQYDKKLYIGKSYDCWLQLPATNDYTIVPGYGTNSGGSRSYHFDYATYTNAPAPGEIIGFFGIEYSEVINKSLTIIADIPGGSGSARTCLTGDPVGSQDSISGAKISTHSSLYSLNGFTNTTYTTAIQENSIFNTFSGGPGCIFPDYTTNRYMTTFIWAEGLHIYNNRFMVVKDKETKKLQLLLTGSFERMVSTINNYPYRSHSPIMQDSLSNCGVFITDTKIGDYTPVRQGANNWPTKFDSNNYPHGYYWGFASWQYQYTMFASRVAMYMVDDYTYYMAFSLLRRQFDIFSNGLDGWLWWYNERQMYSYNNNALTGWTTDSTINLRGTEESGVETVVLDYYNY